MEIFYEVSQDTMKSIIRKAFADGQIWGETYTSWFSPDEEDHERKVKESITKILRAISGRKKKY